MPDLAAILMPSVSFMGLFLLIDFSSDYGSYVMAFFAYLVTLYWMPDVVNLTLLGAQFHIPLNIVGPAVVLLGITSILLRLQ